MRSFPPPANLATLTSTSNSSLLQVPFLNLMSNLIERAGWVQVRVGGNSQESAELVSSLPNGTMLAKDTNNTSGPTSTPPWNIHLTCYTPWGISPNSQIPTGTLVGYPAPPCSLFSKLI